MTKYPPKVHNHGPEDGKGVSCRERIVPYYGRVGECLMNEPLFVVPNERMASFEMTLTMTPESVTIFEEMLKTFVPSPEIGVLDLPEPNLFELTDEENWEYPDKALIEVTWMDHTVERCVGRYIGIEKCCSAHNLGSPTWTANSSRVGHALNVKIIRNFRFG